MLVSCLAYSSTLKMEATCSSETSVNFQHITCRYIPEDTTLHNHCYEILESYLGTIFRLGGMRVVFMFLPRRRPQLYLSNT
jgi:hypothetical protein